MDTLTPQIWLHSRAWNGFEQTAANSSNREKKQLLARIALGFVEKAQQDGENIGTSPNETNCAPRWLFYVGRFLGLGQTVSGIPNWGPIFSRGQTKHRRLQVCPLAVGREEATSDSGERILFGGQQKQGPKFVEILFNQTRINIGWIREQNREFAPTWWHQFDW